MTTLHNPLAILGICVALLGSLASFEQGASDFGSRLGQRAEVSRQQAHAWIVLGGFGSSTTVDSAQTGGSPQPGPLYSQAAPLWGESELDEDPDQDPSSLPGLGDWQLVATIAPSGLTRTSAAAAVLGAQSSRGPPRA